MIKTNFTQNKKNALVLTTASLLFITSFTGTAAARIHDPAQPATVNGYFSAGEAQRAPLSERIQAILHPEPEYENDNDEYVAVKPTMTAADTSIIGTALASEEQCVKYLLRVNPNPDIAVSPEELVSYYYEEGRREGIRPDVAFAQALKETGFFRYGGTVTPDQNNYCGLGTTSAYVKGAYFDTPQIGVRAHIQHLLAYATTRRPMQEVVDPRFDLVRERYGTRILGRWTDLNGRWAVPGHSYGQSIMSMYRSILRE